MYSEQFVRRGVFALVAGYLLLPQFVQSQTPKEQKTHNQLFAKQVITSGQLNYLGATLQQERRLTNHATFSYGGGIHYSFYRIPAIFGTRFINVLDPIFGRNYTLHTVTPYVYAEFRRYFGITNRGNKNKNLENNAANYISFFGEQPLAAGNITETRNLTLASPVGIKLGLRRNLARRFYMEASLGMVAKLSFAQTVFVPRLDFGISMVGHKK